MASGGSEKSLSETPAWRIDVLFLAFILITLLWEKATDKLDHWLKSRKRRGLRHVVRKLQEELLGLGLISLLLIAVEERLLRICVNTEGDSYSKSGGGKSQSKGGSHSEGEPHSPESVTPHFEEVSSGLRLLLAVGGGTTCKDGKESFWSAQTIHQTHIFLFLVAVIHIMYAMLSMVICLWKLKRWKRWELREHHDLVKIMNKYVVVRKNPLLYYWDAWVASFTESVDGPVYIGLRRLFIERMELTESFDFHDFLVNTMEEEFSKVVKFEWIMWLIAALWISAPPYIMFIMTGLALLIMTVVGTKLELVAIKLSHQAYLSYGDRPPLATSSNQSSLIRRSLTRISKGLRIKKGHTDGEVVPAKTRVAELQEEAGVLQRVQSADLERSVRNPSSGMIARTGSMDFSFTNFQGSESNPPTSGGDKTRAQGSNEVSEVAVDISELKKAKPVVMESTGSDPPFASGVASNPGSPFARGPPLLEMSKGPHTSAGHYMSAAAMYSSSEDDEDDTYPGNPTSPGYMRQGHSNFHANYSAQVGGRHGGYGEVHGHAAGAGVGTSSMHSFEQGELRHRPMDGKTRGCCFGCCGGKSHKEKMMHSRSTTFAKEYRGPDSAGLFWFQRPRVMLKAIQYMYFETSLLLAILLFNVWQDTHFIISKDFLHHNWIVFGLVVVGVGLMIHSAYFVLPVYAITTAVGSHCPRSVLQLARMKKIQPRMVHALERLSVNPVMDHTMTRGHVQEPEVCIEEDDQGEGWVKVHVDGNGNGNEDEEDYEEENQKSISMLLGAMVQEQAKKYVDARRVESEALDDMYLLQDDGPARTFTAPPEFEEPINPTGAGPYNRETAFGSFQVVGDTTPVFDRPGSPLRPILSEGQEVFEEEEGFLASKAEPSQYEAGSSRLPEIDDNVEGAPSTRSVSQFDSGSRGEEVGDGQDNVLERSGGSGVASEPGATSREILFSLDDEFAPRVPFSRNRRMPSQHLLENPDAYNKRCTLFGSHANLHDIALLFQKAGSLKEVPRSKEKEELMHSRSASYHGGR